MNECVHFFAVLDTVLSRFLDRSLDLALSPELLPVVRFVRLNLLHDCLFQCSLQVGEVKVQLRHVSRTRQFIGQDCGWLFGGK